jgi:hypothetical protein
LLSAWLGSEEVSGRTYLVALQIEGFITSGGLHCLS